MIAAGLVLLAGCGETFRPVASPLPLPGGNPGVFGNAVVLSASSGALAGSTTHVDVSGDSNAAVHTVGVDPVRGLIILTRTIVANKSDDTLTTYQTFGGPGASTVTITLQGPGVTATCPVFMDSRDGVHLYVAMSGCGNNANAGVALVSLASLTETGILVSGGGSMNVGADPESLVVLPNSNEIYVANKGSGSVTVINAVDNSITNPNIAVGASPSYLLASPDSACVYVANQGSASVSVISTASHAVTATVPVGAGPSFMVFDANLQRVYVANTAGGSVSVLGHNSSCTPTVLAAGVAVGSSPVSIAPLANGTKVYVANFGSGNVSVLNASSFALEHNIALPAGAAPVSIAASSDSNRVFTANSGAGNVSIITTGNDAVLTGINMPNQDPSCASACALQSPTFVMTTP